MSEHVTLPQCTSEHPVQQAHGTLLDPCALCLWTACRSPEVEVVGLRLQTAKAGTTQLDTDLGIGHAHRNSSILIQSGLTAGWLALLTIRAKIKL